MLWMNWLPGRFKRNLYDPTAQLVLRTAWIQLQTIAESYPEFIKLKKQEV